MASKTKNPAFAVAREETGLGKLCLAADVPSYIQTFPAFQVSLNALQYQGALTRAAPVAALAFGEVRA